MVGSDRTLGMNVPITRRDFLNGVSLGVAGAALAPELLRAAQQEFAPERAMLNPLDLASEVDFAMPDFHRRKLC